MWCLPVHAMPRNSTARPSRGRRALPCRPPSHGAAYWKHPIFSGCCPPFYNNLGKRVTKAPKLYMLDPAIVCYLTRQPSGQAALAGAMGGAFFEGLMVMEAVKYFTNTGLKPALWYWRSHDGLEVDLIPQTNATFVPIEIKLTATPTTAHLDSLKRFRALSGEKICEPGILVCRVPDRQPLPYGITALPWQDFSRWIAERIGAPND